MLTRRSVLLACGGGISMLALPVRLAASGPGRVFRVPVDLASRRLLVSCTIEGKGPFALGIDTGGVVSLIDHDLALRLGLKTRGKTGLGIAGRHDLYPMFEARELNFGNVLRQERVLLAGVEDPRFGRDVVGMLAAGCMTTMDAELDFVAREWRLYPDGGPVRAGWGAHEGAIRPGRVGSPHLFGRAGLGGQNLSCLLDTGAPSPIILRPRPARKSGIDLDAQHWSPAQSNGRETQIYRSKQPFEIGGLTLERPLVTVSENAPSFVDDGIIGLPVIQRLNLGTEVKAGRLWTRPNGLPPEPERYNMSGLWIDRKGETMLAGRVGRGSPAERAGIGTGDRIDGMPFGQMIARLNGRAGEQIPLQVTRSGAKRDLTLVLEDYL